MSPATTTGWGTALIEELTEHYDRDEVFVTAVTRGGREFLATGKEFEVKDGWPAVWRLDNRLVPESEIVHAEISGERSE